MSDNNSAIVSKVWSFCNTLRDDGVGYGDYLEQLTYLLFLKMADEYTKPPPNRTFSIPKKYNWESITALCCASWIKRRAYSVRSSPRVRTKFKTPLSLAR
jgi:hypothetical protein